jgi:hypothetical protein
MTVPPDIQKWKDTALSPEFSFNIREGWNPVLDLDEIATGKVFLPPHTRPTNMQTHWRAQRNHVVRELRGTVDGAVDRIRRLDQNGRDRLARGLLGQDALCRRQFGQSSRYYPKLDDDGTLQHIRDGTGLFDANLCGDQHPKIVAGQAANTKFSRFQQSINSLEHDTPPAVQIEHYATQMAKDATCKAIFANRKMIYDRGGTQGNLSVRPTLGLNTARQGREFRIQSCRPYDDPLKSGSQATTPRPLAAAVNIGLAHIPNTFRHNIETMHANGRRNSARELPDGMVGAFRVPASELYGRKVVSRLARVPLYAAAPLVTGPDADRRYRFTNSPSWMRGYDAFHVFNAPAHPPPPVKTIIHPPPPPVKTIIHPLPPPPPPAHVHPLHPIPSSGGGVGKLFGTHCSGKTVNFTRPGFL